MSRFQIIVESDATKQALKTLTEGGETIMQFFAFDHLPDNLQSTSFAFAALAVDVATHLPRNAERTTALRKLLEAKDCAVRAKVAK